MSITFSGFDEWDEKLASIQKKGGVKRNQFVAQEAEILMGHAKDNTPTDTGNLKNNWHRTRVNGGRCEVYNNTDYAAHVEYGHRIRGTNHIVPGKKMLHLGQLQTAKAFKADAEEIVKELLDS